MEILLLDWRDKILFTVAWRLLEAAPPTITSIIITLPSTPFHPYGMREPSLDWGKLARALRDRPHSVPVTFLRSVPGYEKVLYDAIAKLYDVEEGRLVFNQRGSSPVNRARKPVTGDVRDRLTYYIGIGGATTNVKI